MGASSREGVERQRRRSGGQHRRDALEVTSLLVDRPPGDLAQVAVQVLRAEPMPDAHDGAAQVVVQTLGCVGVSRRTHPVGIMNHELTGRVDLHEMPITRRRDRSMGCEPVRRECGGGIEMGPCGCLDRFRGMGSDVRVPSGLP